ncbi:hypothetical protein GC170_13895 [bacterium]|nr:hypothetical protein [bacterium]
MIRSDAIPDFERIRELSRQGRLYFGYGSNLSELDDTIAGRGQLASICRAFVPDTALVFDRYSEARGGGVLSLSEFPGGFVEGSLFEVNAWNELVEKEGVRRGNYIRISLPVLIRDPSTGICRQEIAQSYVTARPEGFVKPGGDYLHFRRQGRASHGLSCHDLDLAAAGEPGGFGGDRFAIFTYGTLCRGESRARVMRTGPLAEVSLAEMKGVTLWRHSSGEYPCLLEADPAAGKPKPVAGDLWTYRADGENAESLSKLFSRLDAIESDARPKIEGLRKIVISKLDRNHSVDEASDETRKHIEDLTADSKSSEYRRTLVDVNCHGRSHRVWTYFYCGPMAGLLPITSGNWRKYAGRWDESLESDSMPVEDRA